MFAKLLKYEWKANAGFLGILSLAALVAGLIGAAVLRFIYGYVSDLEIADGTAAAIMGPLMLLFVFIILALVAYVFAVQGILLYRFYKNKFTDEGYLTFTLPVSAHQIFLSSLVNILIWSAISMIVVGIATLLMVLIGLAPTMAGLADTLKELRDLYSSAQTDLNLSFSYYAMSLVSSLISWISSPVLLMSCITIGAVLAKKHKILTAVVFYYILSMVTNVAFSFLNSLALMIRYSEAGLEITSMVQLGQLLIQILLGMGGYFLSVWLMKKKLNLP